VIEKAIDAVLGGSGPRTADIGGKARTKEVGKAIAAEIKA
jgi:isocitrate/isopropylmalate dehydrogenase